MFEKISLDQWVKDCKGYNIELGGSPEDVYDKIIMPIRSTPRSAGYDFYIPFGITCVPGVKYLVPTGIKADMHLKMWKMCMPADAFFTGEPKACVQKEKLVTNDSNEGNFLALYPRSSLGFKYGFAMRNTVGIIDADYYNNPDNEGHIMVGFTVDTTLDLKAGDKFCQGIIQTYHVMSPEEITVHEDRSGGMGSTGK